MLQLQSCIGYTHRRKRNKNSDLRLPQISFYLS